MREGEGQEQQLCVRRTWLRSTLMPAVTIVKERESSSHQEHQNPATKSCHLWSGNVSLSLLLGSLQDCGQVVITIFYPHNTYLNHSQGDPYVHNSHDSTAAANCSYERKTGGGGRGRRGNMVRSRHHILILRGGTELPQRRHRQN